MQVEFELSFLQGEGDVLQDLDPLCAVLVGLEIEHLVAVLASVLRRIHRLVRMPQEQVRGGFVLGVDRHSHASAERQHLVLESYRLAYGAQDTLVHRIFLHVPDDGHELVATQTGDNVVFAEGVFQARGHRAEYLVPDGVAVGIVDFLEAIQVDKADG